MRSAHVRTASGARSAVTLARDVEERLLCGVLGRPRSRAHDESGGPDDQGLELAQELVERVAVARNRSPGKPDQQVVAFHGRL